MPHTPPADPRASPTHTCIQPITHTHTHTHTHTRAHAHVHISWQGAFESEAQRQEHLWCELGGEALEPSLRSGAIKLLRAGWIVQYAKSEGAVLSRRQELPDEAFIGLDDLMAAIEPQDQGLRVIVLSYGWTTPQHPDPLGATLLRVADVLQHYVGTHGAPEAFDEPQP